MMDSGTYKAFAWMLLAALLALIPLGAKLTWLWYVLSLSVAVLAVFLLRFEEHAGDTRMIALVGVLTALTVASRQLLHGIEFSPVFFVVILVGAVFGFTPAFVVGALSMFVSNLFLGHGPWTPFQMFGVGFSGALASFLPGGRHRLMSLTLYSVLCAYLYGVFTDVFSWIAFIPVHSVEALQAMVLAGMLANTTRAVGNVFFMAVLGSTLLRILERFRRRLTYSVTNR